MIIKALRIRNFRSHQDTSVKLHPITVLVGHGGSGKSNLFDALVNLSVVVRGRVGDAFSPYPWATYQSAKSWGARPVEPIGFEVTICPNNWTDEPFVYDFRYKMGGSVSDPVYQITKEILKRGQDVIFDRDDLSKSKLNVEHHLTDDRSLLSTLRMLKTEDPELTALARGISRIGKYRLEPALLCRPSNLPPPPAEGAPQASNMWLDYGGENLAAVLYQLEETDKGKLDSITQAVKTVFPEFDGFSFNFIGEGRKVGFSVVFSHRAEPVLAPLLSHGMILFIGLMTLLHTPSSPDVIMLEEPENGLDAKAVRAFYAELVKAIKSGQNTKQVLLASHSPYILCEAWNGESREFAYHITEKGGRSQVNPVEAVMQTFNGTLQSDGTMSIRLAERIMSERWQAQATT